jgi:hypothetical protein
MTRKRRALGDVSNQQPAATTNGAEAAVSCFIDP